MTDVCFFDCESSCGSDSLLLRILLAFGFLLLLLVESNLIGKHVAQIVIKVIAALAPLILELGQRNDSFVAWEDSDSPRLSSMTDDAFFESFFDTETSQDSVKFARPVDLFDLVDLFTRSKD